MAIRNKRIKGGNGINYTKELDGPADWSGIVNDTYFKDLSDGLIYWKDLSGVVIAIYELGAPTGVTGDGDYGNIIFVSEVGPTGQTRNDVVGKIMSPVELNWASQIAQSGDTIHVKAGSYTATTTGPSGLSVDGVNHYFEENSKVYKSTTGDMFSTWLGGSFYFSSGGNVYGNGSFYGSGSCGKIMSGARSNYITNFDQFFKDALIFEFNECINTADGCIEFGDGSTADFIIKGKTRLFSSASDCINHNGVATSKLIIECPLIKTTNSGSSAIRLVGGNRIGDVTIKTINIEGPSDGYGIRCLEKYGKVMCDADYITKVDAQGGFGERHIDIKCSRVDSLLAQANIVNIDGHVGELTLGQFSVVNITLCDEFTINNTNSDNAIANITMSNITGSTNTFSGSGTLNLNSVDVITIVGATHPNTNTAYTTGSKTYLFNGLFGYVNLLGKWDNGDTIGVSSGTLIIDNNAVINETTINQIGPCDIIMKGKATDCTFSGVNRFIIEGRTEDCQINYIGADPMIINGATMLVSDQNKQIITSLAPPGLAEVKVYTGGLNTNKFFPFAPEKELLKVTVAGPSAAITIYGTPFTSTTGATAADAAVELVSLIDTFFGGAVTVFQDTPGVDTYIYIESAFAGTPLTVAYGFNTILDSVIRLNSGGVTDIVGGTVIEDPDIN